MADEDVDRRLKSWFNWLSQRGYLTVGGGYLNATFEIKYRVTDRWVETMKESLKHIAITLEKDFEFPESDDKRIDLLASDMAISMLISNKGFLTKSEYLALTDTISRIIKIHWES